jgi:GT2 family glycosyltransferase
VNSQQSPDIIPIVLDFRSSRITVGAIQALRAEGFPAVIVVNSEETGRPDYVLREGDVYKPFSKNIGYAGGMNAGVEVANDMGYRYAWLLNNDAVLMPGARKTMESLLSFAQGLDQVYAFFGSHILDDDDCLWFRGGSIDCRTGSINQIVEPRGDYAFFVDGQLTTASSVDWLTGAGLIVDLQLLRGERFDEHLFLYREEVDLQMRVRQKGLRCLLVDVPLVKHAVGASSGGTRQALGALMMSRNYFILRSRLAGGWSPVWLLRWLVWDVAWPLVRGRVAGVTATIMGATMTRVPPKECLDAAERHFARN